MEDSYDNEIAILHNGDVISESDERALALLARIKTYVPKMLYMTAKMRYVAMLIKLIVTGAVSALHLLRKIQMIQYILRWFVVPEPY